MLGIEGYGSDSENEDVNEVSRSSITPTPSLAPPSASVKTHLLPPKTKRAPKKIAIGLPSLPTKEDDGDDDLASERPAAKKPRLESGAGRSSLLSMLPAPKQKNPIAPERVLGGGKGPGLVFNTPQLSTTTEDYAIFSEEAQDTRNATTETVPSNSLPFIPPSLAKGKANISIEEGKSASETKVQKTASAAPPVDFFSLGNPPLPSQKVVNPTSLNASPVLPSLSAAPAIPTFEPPEPSQNDPYPGYYQLPSGAWAAHDPDYFSKYVKRWEAEYNAHVRALEKGAVKGFEGLETAAVEDVDAMKEMEKAKIEIRDREERKAITKGAGSGPTAPKMNINASKTSGIARSRHQLSTLLKEAYENREALEDKIAQGRRNRKEAGNKYGF